MPITTVKLLNNARRLDRLNTRVAATLAAIKRGQALHLEYTRSGRVWCLSGGRRIADEVARRLRKRERGRCRRRALHRRSGADLALDRKLTSAMR
jgi:hypothetical protein